MRMRIGTAVPPVLLLLSCALPGRTQTPTITNVTNAAIPAIDYPPNTSQLAPRSIATIFGTNLADAVVSASPPWPQTLGGTEVHVVVDTIILGNVRLGCDWRSDASCELTAVLTYASPTQINFVTPDASITVSDGSSAPVLKVGRIVLIRDGVRFDARYDILGGPGYVTLDPFGYTRTPAVFGVGYDCLFSFSLIDPSACGLGSVDLWDGISGLFPFSLPAPLACGTSCSQNPHRALLGAVTDASGQLITAQNPVRQGALITLWMTGLTGLNLDSDTGLLQQSSPGPIGFAVAQGGKDKAATVTYDGFDGVYVGQFKTPPALWAGESAQFAGLDQIRVNFPVCATAAVAMVEKRYDAFMDFVSIVTGTDARIYLPFLISPGDPDCQWTVATTTTLTSSLNPSTVGQAVIFSANVAPSTATGPVTFFDGSATLGSGTLSGGKATLTTSALSSGTHSISAGYGGDGSYNLSTSAALPQTVISKTNTTTTLRSSPFPGGVTFTAQVSPSNGYATVMFFDNGGLIGSVSGLIGSASYNQPIVGGAELTGELLPGTHSITATYSGNSSYNGSASAAIVQTGTTTTLTSSLNPSTAGQSGIFTASVSPSTATGTVTFILGASSGVPVLTSPPPPKTYPPVDVLPPGTPILCLEGGLTTLRNGQAKCTFSLIVVGTLPFTAIYSGDSNHSGSSGGLTQTIR